MCRFELRALSERDAKQVCAWRYEGEYSIYNFSDWDVVVEKGWDLADKKRREENCLAVMMGGQLAAFGRITECAGKADIGVGLAPTLCGQGLGKEIMKLLVQECQRRHPNCQVVLDVRSFNKRAIKCYQGIGFEIGKKFFKDTPIGASEFYHMIYKV